MPVSETHPEREYVRLTTSTFSMRIVAAAIILLFFYYAQGVVITLILSILLAYCLDPAVELLERARIPRTLGSLLMVILLIAVLFAVSYALWVRVSDFAAQWPKYSDAFRQAATAFEDKLNGIDRQVSGFAGGTPAVAAPAANPGIVHQLILRSVGSIYALVLEATFVPFLVFFMLAGKREAWHGTLQLFSITRRTQVKETLEDLRSVLRGYLLGMLLVTGIVIAMSSVFFWAIGLEYPVLVGMASGFLNMVPYIGAVLAWLPPFILALAKWHEVGKFVAIALVLMGIHIFALNLIAPQLVGRRVRLNAVAITISLLFWGWVWGGMGLVLAIPITATLRVICDHTESWRPIGRWLSA